MFGAKFKGNLEQSRLVCVSRMSTSVPPRPSRPTLSWIPVAHRTTPLNGRGHTSTNVFSGSLSGEECRTRFLELLDDGWDRAFDRLELAEEEG